MILARQLLHIWATTVLLSEAADLPEKQQIDAIDDISLVQSSKKTSLPDSIVLAKVSESLSSVKNVRAQEHENTAIWSVLAMLLFAIVVVSIYDRKKLVDVLIGGSCIAIVLLVGVFTFSSLGANMWFSWHPVLMTLAFPCLMTLGRWSYKADDSWGMEERPERRKLHRILMILATVAAVGGYLCIFMAHLPKRAFFGYDFGAQQWNPDRRRIAHSIAGYGVLLAVLLQSFSGLFKFAELNKGVRTMTFHGSLGKVIMYGGAANVVLAMTFWSWSTVQKSVVFALLVLTTGASNFLSTPALKNGPGE